MNPRPATPADFAYWQDFDPQPVVFSADDPTCEPCPAIVTTVPDDHGVIGTHVVRVAWELSEVELVHLAKGGTLWLSTWGGLPPHMLEVAPPPERASE